MKSVIQVRLNPALALMIHFNNSSYNRVREV